MDEFRPNVVGLLVLLYYKYSDTFISKIMFVFFNKNLVLLKN